MVSIARVEPVNEDPRSSVPVRLKSAPDVSPYDVIIFASAVQAFSLAPAMKLYLSHIPSIAGKRTYCFVTQHSKKTWLGGKQALHKITEACKAKGSVISASGIVNWSASTRDQQINDIVCRLGTIQ